MGQRKGNLEAILRSEGRKWPGQNWCIRAIREAKASEEEAKKKKHLGHQKRELTNSPATGPKILQVWVSVSSVPGLHLQEARSRLSKAHRAYGRSYW